MVGFLHDPNPLTKELQKTQTQLNNKQQESSGDPFDIFTPHCFDEFDCSFADSFLDFDSFIADSPVLPLSNMATDVVKVQVFDALDADNEMGIFGICEEVDVDKEKDEFSCLNLEESENIGVVDKAGCGKIEDLGCLIEEEMKKVSIGNVANEVEFVETHFVDDSSNVRGRGSDSDSVGKNDGSNVTSENGNVGKTDMLKSESGGSSSSSEMTSSDEGERSCWNEERKRREMDLEEGEIQESDVDEMVDWSEDDDDEEEDSNVKGPIRSINELPVLPPVPLVNETLLPHHQTLPVGVVSSVIGAQVVVEGVEKHNPLSDGSVLWITESRLPLGIVDEIFGPVKNPYYIVRYNSESEVPAEINQGTLISFVPEFANHVLDDGNLYKKGYDASNENDEEVSADEEFSDDEKEAEYMRMLKMKKRGTNDQKVGNKKKDKRKVRNRSQNGKHDQAVPAGTQPENVGPPVDQSQHLIPPVTGSSDQGIHPSFQGQGSGNRPHFVPPFLHQQQAPGFTLPSSGGWTNITPYQQPQGMGFPNTLQTIGMQFPRLSHPQQMHQMPLPSGAPLQQQFNPRLPSNFMLPFVQPNVGTGQMFAPWPALGQNGFNQLPFGMGGFPGQLAPTPINLGGQLPTNGPQTGGNNNSHPPAAGPGNLNGPLNFNQGNHFGGSWNAIFHGSGRFGPQAGDNSNSQPPAVVPVNGSQTGDNNYSHPPAAVPNSINGPLNFNQGNHFGGGWNANIYGSGNCGPPAGDNGNSQPPAAVPLNGPQTGENSSHPPAAVPGNISGSLNINQGNRFGGGRRANRGRGGRFGRGRGRVQRN